MSVPRKPSGCSMLRPPDRSHDGKWILYMTAGHEVKGTRVDREAEGVGPGGPCNMAIAFPFCLLPAWLSIFQL